jgi:aryl-alcohol dehydrogenase-like predicted oxidoreductase
MASWVRDERKLAVLATLDRVAEAHGASPAQVAIAWLLARPEIVAPISSATSPEQLSELIGAADLRLSPEAVSALDGAG